MTPAIARATSTTIRPMLYHAAGERVVSRTAPSRPKTLIKLALKSQTMEFRMPFPAGQRAGLTASLRFGLAIPHGCWQPFRFASRDLLIIMNKPFEWRSRESHFVVYARVVERHDPNSRVRERTSILHSRKVGPHESAYVPLDRVSLSDLPGSGSDSRPGSGPDDDDWRRDIGQHRRKRSVHILLRLLPSQPADAVHEAHADGHDQPGRDGPPVLCTNPEAVTLQPDLALCRRL